MSRINPATALYQASPSTPRFTPQPDALLYKDLLIFEERLKQNVRRLKRKKQKYQGKFISHPVLV
ncbi:hypothetical protein H4R35_000912 [Dimargaris xerosporica]|nr:hypothetical protein H4R35_000912 [Dimargaris xerosporica]